MSATAAGLTGASLFAGIGGFEEAMRRAGVRACAAVEIDPYCRGVLARHFPGTALFSDAAEVTSDQLRSAGFVPERGILTAGWPCQGNSQAGRRGGMDDPRSGLWVHVARLLAELRPRWFIGENVPPLRTVNGGRDIATVRRDLAQLGYWWAERILDAQYFGVAQERERLFFAGCLGDRAAPVQVLLEPEGGGWDSPAGGAAGPGDPGADPGGARRAGRVVGSLATVGPGGGWRLGADEAAAGHLVVSTIQGGGRRGHRIDAEGAAGGHLILAGTGVRRFTPLERERLMGLPDEWTRWRLGGGQLVEQSDAARDRQTGNAVVIPVAEWIMRRVVAAEQAAA
jgi:DNA (cytosine-5)-methyltransferase 1